MKIDDNVPNTTPRIIANEKLRMLSPPRMKILSNNLQKTYSQYITRFDDHLNKVNLALTNSGSTKSRLTLIKNRVEEQQTTIEELKSTNEDRDISDIIIDFYAMYNAYQSSLTAASKANSQTLLDYL